jgi:hypothetical protein
MLENACTPSAATAIVQLTWPVPSNTGGHPRERMAAVKTVP